MSPATEHLKEETGRLMAERALRLHDATVEWQAAAARIRALDTERAMMADLQEDALRRIRAEATEGELLEGLEGEEPLVVMPPAQVGKRSVLPGGIKQHQAKLAPLGLGEREETVPAKTVTKLPTVADLESRKRELRALGVPLEDVVSEKVMGEPRVLPLSEAQELAAKAERKGGRR